MNLAGVDGRGWCRQGSIATGAYLATTIMTLIALALLTVFVVRDYQNKGTPPEQDTWGARVLTIAMAHGLGAVKEMYLEPFARRFEKC
jgi:hypothetical protein